jgi:hypothetical protein
MHPTSIHWSFPHQRKLHLDVDSLIIVVLKRPVQSKKTYFVNSKELVRRGRLLSMKIESTTVLVFLGRKPPKE